MSHVIAWSGPPRGCTVYGLPETVDGKTLKYKLRQRFARP
jgi:hypothetical protein